MTEDNNPIEMRREWKSYTMRTIDSALTPGTIPNAILIAAATLALKKHRIHLMAASAAVSQATEFWRTGSLYQDKSGR